MNIPKSFQDAVDELDSALLAIDGSSDADYEVLEARLDCMRFAVRALEREPIPGEQRQRVRQWFHARTAGTLLRGPLLRRARNWPEGYPGDHETIEHVYANTPLDGAGLGHLLDRYFLSRTLAVAVRARMRRLSQLLARRARLQSPGAAWLNLACGSCRELLGLTQAAAAMTVHCVDRDPAALNRAKTLLGGLPTAVALNFEVDNALRYADAHRTIERHGRFDTIYSAGLFDYLPDDILSNLLRGLYASLADDGLFVMPFKDGTRYETFDYHWLADWDHFHQRTEHDVRRIIRASGIPDDRLAVERDDTGVLLFFQAHR